MSNVYFVSDLHFNHKNILIYEPCRLKMVLDQLAEDQPEEFAEYDFDEIMNRYKTDSDFQKFILGIHNNLLVHYWNRVVKNDDVVWFLGDLGFGDSETVKGLAQKLNGHKRMIMGNHDKQSVGYYKECGFEFVSQYPIILKRWFVLSHAPLEYINENSPFFNIYGHVHSHEMFKTVTEHSQCVCIERQDFMPITLAVFDGYVEDAPGDPAKERRE